MDVTRLYSTIGSVVVATAFAAMMVASSASTRHSVLYNARKQPSRKLTLHPRVKRKKVVEFHYRGYVISATAEDRHFKNDALIEHIQRTIRFLRRKCIPINSFFIVYYSDYSGDQLSIQMHHLDTINERNSWLEEVNS